jgi:predicted dehydrogenase
MGFGRRVHVPGFFAHDRFQLAAVAGARPHSADETARLSGARAYDDWTELVARDDLDVISIATAPPLHAPVALAALRSGKAILLEKPTAMDAREAGQIADEARTRGLVGAIVHEFRFWPARLDLRRRIAQGEIGRPLAAHVIVPRSNLATLRSQTADWWARVESGGGVLGASASHQVDSLTWWLGEPVVRVWADLRTAVPVRPGEGGGRDRVSAEDSYTLFLQFASGATATVALSVAGAAFGDRWEVLGERGALCMEADARLYRVPDGSRDAQAVPLPVLDAPPALPGTEPATLTAPFLRLLDRFAAALDGNGDGAADLPDLAQGLHVQRVLDGARLSAATGSAVRILP